MKKILLSILRFGALYQITNINIYHKVTRKHTKVIEGRWRLNTTDVPEPEEAHEYDLVDDGGSTSDGEYEGGLGETGLSTDVYAAETKDVDGAHQILKSNYISSHMLKHPSFTIQ